MPIPSPINLSIGSLELVFSNVELHFLDGISQDVFSQKNNKTVKETLSKPRYSKFIQDVQELHFSSLDIPLGKFLLELKKENNILYKKFLN